MLRRLVSTALLRRTGSASWFSAAALVGVTLVGPLASSVIAQDGMRDGPRWGRGGGDEPMRRGMGGMGGMGMRGMGGFGQTMQPEFLPRDLPLMVDALQLDAGQALILEALFADYTAAHQEGSGVVTDAMRDIGPRLFRSFMTPQVRERVSDAMGQMERRIQRMRESGGELSPEAVQQMMEDRMFELADEIRAERQASGEEAETMRVMGEMVVKLDQWREQREAMRTRLIEGLKAQLNERQLEEWPVFERRFDRLKSLPQGQLSGESTDLINVIDRLGLPDEVIDAIDPILENYEVRLAAALKARNDYLAQAEPRLLRAIQTLDMRNGMDIMRRQMQYRVALRDVNEEFRATIAYELPEEHRAEFQRAAGLASFDRIFRPTRGDQVFAAVREFEDLSDDTRTQIDQLELAFQMELAQANEQLVTLTKRHEPQEQLEQAERFAGMIAGGFPPRGVRGDNPVRDAFNARQELIDRHVERLAAVLSPEQAAALPQRPQRRQLGGGFDNLPPEMQERILRAVDRNNNGIIDPEEQAEAFRLMREMWRERRQG